MEDASVQYQPHLIQKLLHALSARLRIKGLIPPVTLTTIHASLCNI